MILAGVLIAAVLTALVTWAAGPGVRKWRLRALAESIDRLEWELFPEWFPPRIDQAAEELGLYDTVNRGGQIYHRYHSGMMVYVGETPEPAARRAIREFDRQWEARMLDVVGTHEVSAKMDRMAIENHTPESAYATKVDSQGRPNIVMPREVPAAEVTAMAARADADMTALYGAPSAAVSGNAIKRSAA